MPQSSEKEDASAKPGDEPKGRNFYAAPVAKRVDVTHIWVEVIMIVDLGFRVYHEARIRLWGITIPGHPDADKAVSSFVESWIAAGAPDSLELMVYELVGTTAIADIRRRERDEDGKRRGLGSLGLALVEQGLGAWIS